MKMMELKLLVDKKKEYKINGKGKIINKARTGFNGIVDNTTENY